MPTNQKIIPCLWFDGTAEAAATFYVSLFADSRITRLLRFHDEVRDPSGQPAGTVMTVDFELAGYHFVGLNGGPQFRFNPAVSFFVVAEDEAEVERLWAALGEGGTVMMPLDRYDWSPRYGWLSDRFGVSWQIALGKIEEVGQKITPSLLFVGDQCGRAEQAVELYTGLFPGSHVDGIARADGLVLHAQFGLGGEKMMVVDSAAEHHFAFTEAVSLQIACATQDEVDHYWAKLVANGGEEGHCGWLKDPFGVSWQVVPSKLVELLHHPDSAATARLTKAFLAMKKFDIAALERAFAGTEP